MAIIGVTASFGYETAPAVYHTVSEVATVNFPGMNVGAIDTTHLGITDYGMTYMPGMVDAGESGFEIAYDPAEYAGLVGLARQVVNFRLAGPLAGSDSDVVTCDGFITKLDIAVTAPDKMVMSGSVKWTGIPSVNGVPIIEGD